MKERKQGARTQGRKGCLGSEQDPGTLKGRGGREGTRARSLGHRWQERRKGAVSTSTGKVSVRSLGSGRKKKSGEWGRAVREAWEKISSTYRKGKPKASLCSSKKLFFFLSYSTNKND